MHETTLLLIEVGALLLGMSLLGRLALLIGISPIPFYLLLGLAFGEGGSSRSTRARSSSQTGAEIGIILLLALLGLEYTAAELFGSLKSARRRASSTPLLNALPGAALALLLGWGPVAAVALAGVTWVSSSGVIAKAAARPRPALEPGDPGDARGARHRGPGDGVLPAGPLGDRGRREPAAGRDRGRGRRGRGGRSSSTWRSGTGTSCRGSSPPTSTSRCCSACSG